MTKSHLSAVLLCALLLSPLGCKGISSNTEPPLEDSEAGLERTDSGGFGSKPPSWNKDVEDPYGFVGDMARSNRQVEKDPDPWFKNLFMSGEARNIERNLGVD